MFRTAKIAQPIVSPKQSALNDDSQKIELVQSFYRTQPVIDKRATSFFTKTSYFHTSNLSQPNENKLRPLFFDAIDGYGIAKQKQQPCNTLCCIGKKNKLPHQLGNYCFFTVSQH
jgi:hypothetical protein